MTSVSYLDLDTTQTIEPGDWTPLHYTDPRYGEALERMPMVEGYGHFTAQTHIKLPKVGLVDVAGKPLRPTEICFRYRRYLLKADGTPLIDPATGKQAEDPTTYAAVAVKPKGTTWYWAHPGQMTTDAGFELGVDIKHDALVPLVSGIRIFKGHWADEWKQARLVHKDEIA